MMVRLQQRGIVPDQALNATMHGIRARSLECQLVDNKQPIPCTVCSP